MKKTLLLSMAASAVLFAGGDIVEPVIPAAEPVAAPCPTSNLKWYGQTVLYYETTEAGNAATDYELFDGNAAIANAGIQIGVTGSNLLGSGLGFGAEVVALGTLGLEKDGEFNANGVFIHDYVSGVAQLADQSGTDLNSGELTQLYLSYTLGNTTAKVGRMQLPQSLSPFAFSEDWNVFKNTFEAALLINSDLPDTTLVGAWVKGLNSIYNLGSWIDANDGDGIFMLTAQNKSIEGLTLTASVYYASEMKILAEEDLLIAWGDAKFMMPVAGHQIGFGVQGGMIDIGLDDPTMAYGAKAMGKFNLPAVGNVALCAAYSGVDKQELANLSTTNFMNQRTPLYTQLLLNDDYISGGSSNTADTFMVKASGEYELPEMLGMKGNNIALSVAYSQTTMEDVNGNDALGGDYTELDVVASTKLAGAEVMAAYIMTEVDDGSDATDSDNVRIWAKWNF